MNYPIYLDHNATTPCAEEVIAAMLPYFGTHFGNAASKNHPYGWEAEQAVEEARESIAQLIGAKSKELIFTIGTASSSSHSWLSDQRFNAPIFCKASGLRDARYI